MNNASIHVYPYQFNFILGYYYLYIYQKNINRIDRNASIRKIFENLFKFMNTIMTSASKQDKTLVGSGQKIQLQSFLTNLYQNKVLPAGENSCFLLISIS